MPMGPSDREEIVIEIIPEENYKMNHVWSPWPVEETNQQEEKHEAT